MGGRERVGMVWHPTSRTVLSDNDRTPDDCRDDLKDDDYSSAIDHDDGSDCFVHDVVRAVIDDLGTIDDDPVRTLCKLRRAAGNLGDAIRVAERSAAIQRASE